MSLPRMSKKESWKVWAWLNTTKLPLMKWGKRSKTQKSSLSADAKNPKPVIDLLDTDLILVREDHREIKDEAVDGLADSIQAIGMQHPITVRQGPDGKYVLIAGGHRLAAHKRLGLRKIQARVIEGDRARIWSISENLHRVEQSQLDRADAIVSYAKERGLLEGGLSAQPGGRQPNDRGNSRVARALGIDRKQVRQARQHADICEEAKVLLRVNGLDSSIAALNAVAKFDQPEKQIGQARILIEKRRRPKGRSSRPQSSNTESTDSSSLATTTAFLKLKKEWESLPIRSKFEQAPVKARQRFIDEVLLRPS
jgi:ParB-like chromosome segregation protein Spo0J